MSKGNPNPDTSGLRPWKPGQSGNPRGGSRRRRLDDVLAEYMAREVFDEDGKPLNQTVADRFIEQVINLAMAGGNPALIREIFDRHDGKVPDPESPMPDVENATDAELEEIAKGKRGR